MVAAEVAEPGAKRDVVNAFRAAGLSRAEANALTETLFEQLRRALLHAARGEDEVEDLIVEGGLPDERRIGFYTGTVCVEHRDTLACLNLKPRYPWLEEALRYAWSFYQRAARKTGPRLYASLAARLVVADTPHPHALLAALEAIEAYAQRPDVGEEAKRSTIPLMLALAAAALTRAARIYRRVPAPGLAALRAQLLALLRRHPLEWPGAEDIDYEHLLEVYALTRSAASLGRAAPHFTLIPTPRAYEAYLHASIAHVLEEAGWRLSGVEPDATTGCRGLVFEGRGQPTRLYPNCTPSRLSRIVCRLTGRRGRCKTLRPDAVLEAGDAVIAFEAKYRELNGKRLTRADASRAAAYIADVTRDERLTLVLTHVNERLEPRTIEAGIDGKRVAVHVVPLTPGRRRDFEELLRSLLPQGH